MSPWARFVLAAGVTLAFGAGLAWWQLVRPYQVLPRPLEAIEADWARIESTLPPLPEAEAASPELRERVDALLHARDDEARTRAALTLRVSLNAPPPPTGCSLLASDDAPGGLTPITWFRVAEVMREIEGGTYTALRIASAVKRRELLGFMVATDLRRDAGASLPHTADLLAALRVDVRCTDEALRRLEQGVPGSAAMGTTSTWPIDLARERWVYRDHMARLLHALDAAELEPTSLREALQPFRAPPVDAPVASLLVEGVVRLLDEALTDAPAPTLPTARRPEPRSRPFVAPAPTGRDARDLPPDRGFDDLVTAARVLPHRGLDGAVDGVRLSAIRRASLGDDLGLRNGDVLHAIEGLPVHDADELKALGPRLATQPSLRVTLTRRGEPFELVWSR